MRPIGPGRAIRAWSAGRFGCILRLSGPEGAGPAQDPEEEKMSRPAADRRPSFEGNRLKRFVEIERTRGEEGSHPATRALHERPAERDDGTKVREYARIERGRTA